MPKLSPQRIADRKTERAQAYIRAMNNWETASLVHGALSKESIDAFRSLKYHERQWLKVKYT